MFNIDGIMIHECMNFVQREVKQLTSFSCHIRSNLSPRRCQQLQLGHLKYINKYTSANKKLLQNVTKGYKNEESQIA